MVKHMEFIPTAGGGRLLRGQTPDGKFSVKWDAQAKLIAASAERPKRRRAGSHRTGLPVQKTSAGLERDSHPARADEPPASIPMTEASIITTCKGRLDHLKQTLPAMLEQGAGEVILVDYACPQRSGDWTERTYGDRVKVVRVEPGTQRFHLAHARNVGARAASGAVLAFVDADALLSPRWLGRTLALMDGAGAAVARVETAPHTPGREWALNGTFAVRADALEKENGFDEGFTFGWGAEDDDLMKRATEHGGGVRWDPMDALHLPHDDAARTAHYAEKDRWASQNLSASALSFEV